MAALLRFRPLQILRGMRSVSKVATPTHTAINTHMNLVAAAQRQFHHFSSRTNKGAAVAVPIANLVRKYAQAPPPPPKLIEPLTPANFQDLLLNQPRPVAVFVFSPQYKDAQSYGKQLAQFAQGLGGRVVVSPLDVSLYPQIAQQIHVTSVPSVLVIHQGRGLSKFEGKLDELSAYLANLRRQLTGESSAGSVEELTEVAQEALKEKMYTEAKEAFQALLSHQNASSKHKATALAGLTQCVLADGLVVEARELAEELKKSYVSEQNEGFVKQAISKVDLATLYEGVAKDAEKPAAAVARLATDAKKEPVNPQSLHEYVIALYASGSKDEAVTEGLRLVRKHKKWNEEAGRKLLVKIFDAEGPESEWSMKGRKRLNNVWFL
eukprot:Colp12_sorted_trinity150504_noHs@36456